MDTTPRELAARLYADVWGAGNLSGLEALLSEDVVVHLPSVEQALIGLDEYRRFVAAYHGAFDELEFTVEDQVGEGDKLATRWSARLKHGAERRTVTGISMHRFEAGRIVECWDSWDTLATLGATGTDPLAGFSAGL